MRAIPCRHAWMQKHPSPSQRGRDFHWHPATLPAPARSALTELASRAGRAPAALWSIEADRVMWGRTFAAVAPGDGRRYTGLAVAVVEGVTAADLPATLQALALPPAAPYQGEPTEVALELRPPGPAEPLPVEPAQLERLCPGAEGGGLARALVFGGGAPARDPHEAALPALAGRLLSWLPESERVRPRSGWFGDGGAAPPGREAAENLVHYLSLAWLPPGPVRERQPDFGRRSWQLVLELAAAHGGLVPLFDHLTSLAAAWDGAAGLARYLVASGAISQAEISACERAAPAPLASAAAADAGRLWNRVLHYWGRGLLRGDRIGDRLALTLAHRIVADHLFHLDQPARHELPERYLRRLRYEALLPRARVDELLTAARRHVPSLRSGELRV